MKVSIVRRFKKLEDAFLAEQPEDWVDFYMWSRSGGVFGHSRYRVSKSRGEILRTPCSDEEEVAIMRAHYEDEGRRLYGGDAEVSFAEYLVQFSYLCPETLVERMKLIIERVRSEENGALR